MKSILLYNASKLIFCPVSWASHQAKLVRLASDLWQLGKITPAEWNEIDSLRKKANTTPIPRSLLFINHVSMTVQRGDLDLELRVPISTYLRGRNKSDDPTEVHTMSVGFDDDRGFWHVLTDEEERRAESLFLDQAKPRTALMLC